MHMKIWWDIQYQSGSCLLLYVHIRFSAQDRFPKTLQFLWHVQQRISKCGNSPSQIIFQFQLFFPYLCLTGNLYFQNETRVVLIKYKKEVKKILLELKFCQTEKIQFILYILKQLLMCVNYNISTSFTGSYGYRVNLPVNGKPPTPKNTSFIFVLFFPLYQFLNKFLNKAGERFNKILLQRG